MTITNVAPVKATLTSVKAGYSKVSAIISGFQDSDVVYKRVFVYNSNDSLNHAYNSTDLATLSVSNSAALSNNTTYKISAAYLDAMVDTDLQNAGFGYYESDPLTFTTQTRPTFAAISSTSVQADVGVGIPYVTFTLNGYAESVEIEYREYNSGDSWQPLYFGAFSASITIPVQVGTHEFRIRGMISLPLINYSDYSSYAVSSPVTVDYAFAPPSSPTSINFSTIRVADGVERFDLKVGWSWSRGSGSAVKQFVLRYTTEEDYQANSWANAKLINTSTTRNAVISGFPFNVPHRFMVLAVSWGPEASNTSYSSHSTFTLTSDTAADLEITPDTNIEVTYAYIRAYYDDGSTKHQTFNLDASTGNVSIGRLDNGVAPISVDAVNNTVSVDGAVITDTINAANFVLTNLTGTTYPSLRSSMKTSYTSSADGIWAGYDQSDGVFKFSLGNSSNYMKWNGSSLSIRGTLILSNGTDAVSAITSANEAASAAQTTAAAANTTANAANTTADSASTAASNAQSTADSAQSTADSANTAASNAQSTANAANTAASNAQSTANAANTAATNANNAAAAAQARADAAYALAEEGGSGGVGGGGFYSISLSNISSFSMSAANTYFETLYGAGNIPLYAVLTQYESSDHSEAYSAMWNGSNWVSPAMFIHGDAFVNGTIRTDKLVADSAFLNTMGVNVIYDNPAVATGSPEANYSMKIDLTNGSIHIR